MHSNGNERKDNSSEVIHIFFASDDNYVRQLLVAAASVRANTASSLHFHIFDDGISTSNRKSIESLMAFWSCSCEFIKVDKAWLANFPLSEEYSMATYLRLRIPSCLPGIDRCIYLDPDLIVRHDIAELWSMDLQGKAVAAVKDIDTDFLSDFKKRLGLSDSHIYFNAGVLVMDLKKLRETGFEKKAVDFAKRHPEKICVVDQDILNYLLQGDVAYFPLRWNFCPLWYHDGTLKNWAWRDRHLFYDVQERIAAEEDAAIVHFANRIKPWHCSKEALQHSYREEYFDYVAILDRELERAGLAMRIAATKTPAVSVIVPCYNVEAYLNKCMDSLLGQTFTDIEIIAIDDGATDATGAMLDCYAKWNTKISVVHKKNGGLGAAYNAGLSRARGKYIGFVEPDDWIAPDMMESLYRKAEKSGAEITKCGFYLAYSDSCWEDYKKFRYEDLTRKRHKFVQLHSQPFGHLGFWAGLYRRDFLASHDIRFLELPGAGYVDTHFFWTSHAAADSIVIIDKPFYFYRVTNPDASLKITDRRFFLVMENYRQIKQHLERQGLYGVYRSRILVVQYLCYMSVFHQLAPEYQEEFAELMRGPLSEISDADFSVENYPPDARVKLAWLRAGSFYKKQRRVERFRKSFLGKCCQFAKKTIESPSFLFTAEPWHATETTRRIYDKLSNAGIWGELLKIRELGVYKALRAVWRVCVRDIVSLLMVLVRVSMRLILLSLWAGRRLASQLVRTVQSKMYAGTVDNHGKNSLTKLIPDESVKADLIRPMSKSLRRDPTQKIARLHRVDGAVNEVCRPSLIPVSQCVDE